MYIALLVQRSAREKFVRDSAACGTRLSTDGERLFVPSCRSAGLLYRDSRWRQLIHYITYSDWVRFKLRLEQRASDVGVLVAAAQSVSSGLNSIESRLHHVVILCWRWLLCRSDVRNMLIWLIASVDLVQFSAVTGLLLQLACNCIR